MLAAACVFQHVPHADLLTSGTDDGIEHYPHVKVSKIQNESVSARDRDQCVTVFVAADGVQR